MIIQHNITALNSGKNLKRNTGSLSKNLERLSSGYRINRAGDDAAGLAISEGLRAITNGISQAQNNVQDGIGMIQTAEGAMQEIHAMLNRTYQLCIASANGTYDEIDRGAMEEEVRALQEEIQRITDSTDFNGVPLLKGKPIEYVERVKIEVNSGLPDWVVTDKAMTDGQLTEEYMTEETYTDSSGVTKTFSIKHAAGTLDFSAFDLNPAASVADLIGTGFFSTCYTCSRHYSIRFTDDIVSTKEQSGSHMIYNIGIHNITTAEDLVKAIIDGTESGNPDSHFTKLAQDPGNTGKLIVYDDRSWGDMPAGTDYSGWTGWDNPSFGIGPENHPDYGKFGSGVAVSSGLIEESEGDIQLQIGPAASEILKVHLPNTMAWFLGTQRVSVLTQDFAHRSVTAMKEAIEYLSRERGRMGGYENRLEHTANSLAVNCENLTSVESRIRDTDMAEEVTSFTKNNILQQAAFAMLTQANAFPQKVLSLLQT